MLNGKDHNILCDNDDSTSIKNIMDDFQHLLDSAVIFNQFRFDIATVIIACKLIEVLPEDKVKELLGG